MKKLTYEEKMIRIKNRKQKLLDNKPILGMAYYEMRGVDATIKMQVIGLTKYSVTMRMINGKGTVKLTSKNGLLIEDFIKIEMAPCDTTPSIIRGSEIVQISQGTDCNF